MQTVCKGYQQNSFRNPISVSNSLNPEQARHFVGLDLGANCLQRLSADDKNVTGRRFSIIGLLNIIPS